MTTSGEHPQDGSAPREMSREQADGLLHILAADQIAAMDAAARVREKEKFHAELEQKLPGITKEFEHLIRLLPDPNSVYSQAPEFPVAASVVRLDPEGKLVVLGSSLNRVNATEDSTAHAELEALKAAEKTSGSKHLDGCFLLSTLEPCVMCCGAIDNTEVSGVVYSAGHNDVAGKHALVSGVYKPYRTSLAGYDAETYFSNNPDVDVVGGFMRDEVLKAIKRTPVTFQEYYSDPDA